MEQTENPTVTKVRERFKSKYPNTNEKFKDYMIPFVSWIVEGTMKADIGDWIIKGVKGEFYPCKPDIFEATYDVVKFRCCACDFECDEIPEFKEGECPNEIQHYYEEVKE